MTMTGIQVVVLVALVVIATLIVVTAPPSMLGNTHEDKIDKVGVL